MSTPYFERGGITILHGEALDRLRELPDESVDAVITDPPYSSGGFTRSDRNIDPVNKYQQDGVWNSRPSFSGDNRDARSWSYWCALWMGECLRIVKPGGYFLTFTDWRQLPTASDTLQAGGFVWRGLIAWDKGEGARAPNVNYFRHQCEYVIWGTKGPNESNEARGPWAGCFRYPTLQADKFHLTGKPTPLLRSLIQCVPIGGTVLDPFFGSGTTGVAAFWEGRKCVGIELDEANCSIAARRLDQEVLPLPTTPAAKETQASLEGT